MKVRNYRLLIAIRILLILGLSFATYYVIDATPFWLLACWLGLFALLAFFDLIRFLKNLKGI